MCTAANAQAIQEIVEEYVQDEKNFTAFDITQQGLERGTTTESHGHLKSSVHSLWAYLQGEGYDRSLIPAPGGRDTWLYHPLGADIQADIQRVTNATPDDDGDDDGALPSPNTTPKATLDNPTLGDPIKARQGATVPAFGGGTATLAAPVTSAAAVGSANPAGQTREVTDREGRLHIGTAELQKLKCYPGRKIHVFETDDTGKIELIPHDADTDGDLAVSSYTVNKDGRLRISKRVLDAAFGISYTGAFNIVVYSDKIVVSTINA